MSNSLPGRVRAAREQVRRAPSEAGVSLLEIIVVLAIMAVIAGLVVPNVIGRPDQARATVARTDMQSISAALKIYRLDTGSYPTSLQGLAALVERPSGPSEPESWNPDGYLDALPLDPWGRPYGYKARREGGFELSSLGADGRQGGDGPNADLVHAQR